MSAFRYDRHVSMSPELAKALRRHDRMGIVKYHPEDGLSRRDWVRMMDEAAMRSPYVIHDGHGGYEITEAGRVELMLLGVRR